VRGSRRGGAVNGGVGRDHGTHYRPAGGANCDANQGTNSFRGSKPAFRSGTNGSANARSGESADYQADHGMLAAPGAGSGRDAYDGFAFHRNIRSFFLQCEYIVGNADEFSVVAFHAGFDHNNALSNPQATQVGPRSLLFLSTESDGEPEDKHKKQAEPQRHEEPPRSTDIFDKSQLLLESS
jgi:hypothetical protein